MGAAKKTKRYMSPRQIHQEGIVPWSTKTIQRRIEDGSLPAIKDQGGWLIDLDDLDDYMEQRKQNVQG